MVRIKCGIESEGPEVETEIRGIVGVVTEIVINQMGEVIAVNVEIDQVLIHQIKNKGQKR